MVTGGRVYGGMTPAERRARRRAQLLEAGLEVFARRGWARATVADVCRAAGLSQRYFYEQFADREGLFLAITDRIAEEVDAVVREAAAAPDRTPAERVHGVLAALAAYFAGDPRTVRVALVESFATPELRDHRRALLAAFAQRAAGLMASLRPGADRRGLELSAMVLTGGIAEALAGAVTGGVTVAPDELVAHLTRLYTAAADLEA